MKSTQASDSWFQGVAARDIHMEQLKKAERFNGRAAMVGIVGRAVVDRARALAQRPTPTHIQAKQNQHKLAAVRKVRIGPVRRESYALESHALSA